MAATAAFAENHIIQIEDDPGSSDAAFMSWGRHVLIGIAIGIAALAAILTAVIYAVADYSVGEAAAIAVWVALWAGLFVGGTGGAALFAARHEH